MSGSNLFPVSAVSEGCLLQSWRMKKHVGTIAKFRSKLLLLGDVTTTMIDGCLRVKAGADNFSADTPQWTSLLPFMPCSSKPVSRLVYTFGG